MSGCATLTVPILDTAVGILPPPSTLLRTVQVMPTVNRRGRVFTVFITLVTDRPLTTDGVLREVTAVIPGVKHRGLGIVIWFRTESVLWCGLFAEAMPECATVELIWKPARTKILALDMLIIRCAVWWGGGCSLTFFIAFITDRPPTTLGLLWEVAAHVCCVKHRGFWVVRFLRAQDVFSKGLSLVTVPEGPTVVLVRVIPRSILVSTTVYNLVLRDTGRLLCGGG